MTEPGPGRILSPAGTRLQLNCSVTEGIVLRWGIQLPDLPDGSLPVETDRAGAEAFLMERGITFQNLGTPVSELIFNGDERNSHSIVRCQATMDIDSHISFSSDQAEVIIYGRYIAS